MENFKNFIKKGANITLILFGIIIIVNVFIPDNETTRSQRTKSSFNKSKFDDEIYWALYEKPLLIAVEVDSYDGDIIKSGKYSAEVTSTNLGRAEVFNIVVSNRKLLINECISIIRDVYSESYKSNINAEYYHYSVGGLQNEPIMINLSKGQYVHVIPNTYYSMRRGQNLDGWYKVYGVFEMKKI